MENVGLSLDEVSSLESAFSALADIAHACKLLCQSGYNHRDLSCGNIIVDEIKGEGRLGDLEFAKLHGMQASGHNIRSGTPDFMALEVLLDRYYFGDWHRKAPQLKFSVRHNAGHDLESILWIAVFTLYNSLVFDANAGNISVEAVKQSAIAWAVQRNKLFNYGRRSEIFSGPGGLAGILCKDKANRAVVLAEDYIDQMEVALKNEYKKFEAKLSETDRGETRNHEFLPAHHVFEDTLRAMSSLFKGKTFIYIGPSRARS